MVNISIHVKKVFKPDNLGPKMEFLTEKGLYFFIHKKTILNQNDNFYPKIDHFNPKWPTMLILS
jgi:hypothetical protein